MTKRTNLRDSTRVKGLAVVGTVLLLALGILVGRGLSPSEPAAPNSVPSIAPGEDGGLLHTQSEEGAVTAATVFAQVMVGPSGDEESYRNEMAALAAPQWKERARELATNAIDFVRDRYGEGGDISFQPLRYRIKSYLPQEAVIELWGVVLGSGPAVAGLEESWITGTLRLSWIESEWKVTGQSSRGGPTPELLRTDRGPSAPSMLDGFREYESAPTP